MFGQDDNQQQDQNQSAPAPQTDVAASPMAGFTPPTSIPTEPVAIPDPTPDNTLDETATETIETTNSNDIKPPDSNNLSSGLSMSAPIEDATAATEPATSAPTPLNDTGTAAPADDLLKIKQDALQQLSPLVNHLDQSPEERFRTTMMMIQATDDSSLIQSAYDAAQEITDEKVKAQALLDVVNEINYFSQQQGKD